MSVGVCIINKNGVALAADSAGTLSAKKMFYNSMDKVFKISSNNVLGAIAYGNTTLHNVSIDIILNLFSNYLDEKVKLSDLENVIDFFKDFFKDNWNYLGYDTCEKIDCQSLIKDLVDEWGNKIKNVISLPDSYSKIELVLKELENIINRSIKIKDYDVSNYINEEYSSYFNERMSIVCKELDEFSDLKEHLWNLIRNFFNLSLTNEKNNCIGVLFAGFGEKLVFPSYVHLNIYNCIGGNLKFEVIEKYNEDGSNAKILPLAQPQTINTFCKGISDEMSLVIPNLLTEQINNTLNNLPNDLTVEQKNKISQLFASIPNELSTEISNKSRNEEIEPLISSVKVLPLPEMAFLAENLVNITSLKRLYFLDNNQQTVGGPVDVATLSMSHGFEWIKNKNNK